MRPCSLALLTVLLALGPMASRAEEFVDPLPAPPPARSGPLPRQQFDALIEAILAQHLDESLTEEELLGAAAGGILEHLAEHELGPTHLYRGPWAELARLTDDGVYLGVGARVVAGASPWPEVRSLLRDSPAAAAGIQVGDWLVAINGQSTLGSSPEWLARVLTGYEEGPLDLVVQRAEAVHSIALHRAKLPLESVFQAGLRPPYGYIRIERFHAGTPLELAEALRQQSEAGARGLLLDLRGNRGGRLSAAVACADLFVEPGFRVLETESRSRGQEPHQADFPVAFDGALVALIDGSTRGAAEVLAATLQARGAPLVGLPTGGRPVGHLRVELSGDLLLSVPAAKLTGEAQANWTSAGIRPDLEVARADPDASAEYLQAEDDQLAVALETLKRSLAGDAEVLPPEASDGAFGPR